MNRPYKTNFQEVLMEEKFFSGYCRRIDGSRMVTVEIDEDGKTVDCDFGSCPYEGQCPIAAQIGE